MSRANRPTTPGGRIVRQPPTVVDIAPNSSVASLKSAILKADSRPVEDSENLVLWRVEMTEDEMIVIEERGGLKNGQMPWPYVHVSPMEGPKLTDQIPTDRTCSFWNDRIISPNLALLSLIHFQHPHNNHLSLYPLVSTLTT